MKGFYDKILVDVANKLGKKFGAKVGTTQCRTGQDAVATGAPPRSKRRRSNKKDP
jgi:hypothetical protein